MSTPAELLGLARQALAGYVELSVDDDGSLTFVHSGVPCAVQAVQLAEGLAVLSTTCVLGWDLPATPELDARVARLGAEVQFGGLGLLQRDTGADVTLRYAFPAAGLDAEPLATLLLLVVGGASRARAELLA